MTHDFRAHLQGHNTAAVRLTCILCAALMPAGFTLDLLTNQERVWEFLGLRLASAAVSLLVLGLSRLSALRTHSYSLIVAVILACTGAMEIMILRLSDPAGSPYYAGLNLCILGAGLVYVWSLRQTLYVCLLVLALWLLPALAVRPPLYGAFFNNLYFLVLTSIIAIFANSMRYNLAKREWEAQTALDQTSADLKRALERLREMDRLKSQFFANISHELRTPLALIRAPIEELISKDTLPTAAKNTLQVALRNALRLNRLIDGLLDLARLEAGQLKLRLDTVNVGALVGMVVGAFQPAAESMGLLLTTHIDPACEGVSVLGDSEKLEVILTNLLGNALKFTTRGGRISVEVARSPNTDAIEVRVRDTGLGIPRAEQAVIFERFRRIESPLRKQGGAGIGLALVKELVELHGGQVRVESEPKEGACFIVTLPLGTAHMTLPPQETPAPSLPDLDERGLSDGRTLHAFGPALAHVTDGLDPHLDSAGRSSSQALRVFLPMSGGERAQIVVAEDNVELRNFLRELLSPYYKVSVASDGKEALELVQSCLPDLVISDVMMPNMSGGELCQQLKADPRTQAIPVILLTARAGIDETTEGFGHGAVDYLIKPFSPRELLIRTAVQLKLRRLTAQVAHAARLAAVGTLAAGVAHEIKNPLNAIGTAAAALRKREALTDSVYTDVLDMVQECVDRIAEITTALTDHARPADGEGVSLFDIRQGVETTLLLLGERLRSAGVSIVRDYQTERLILGRPRQLNQVFLNLLDNALRACKPGGRIFVRLTDTAHATLVLGIGDEGEGVPVELRERIFDAFFTTRQPGDGTGLGLYLSRQILSAHGGTLVAGAHPLGGAEFVIEIPIGTVQGGALFPSEPDDLQATGAVA